ncbi:opacity protein-like surface antigen [Bradyrhizobium sp. USDA 4341]
MTGSDDKRTSYRRHDPRLRGYDVSTVKVGVNYRF